MDLDKLILSCEEEVVRLRRDFHRHPELGLEEHRTSKIVSDYLSGLGLDPAPCHGTGVVGLLEGSRPGPTLMLRADLDALPITEETGLEYASVNKGVMHACGHDAHTAMLLTAAKVLTAIRDELAGRVKFVFQPNEENVGALAMIQEGVLENPTVDACLGLHVWAPLPLGQVGLTPGPVMAGMEHFDLIVKGKGGHTATPQSAVDPVLCAAAVIQGVQQIQTREIDALKEPTVIMFGRIQGGTASNIIPDSVTLSGTMRYLFQGDPDGPASPKSRLKEIAEHICQAHRTGCDLRFLYGHPTLVNDARIVDLVRGVVQAELREPVLLTDLVTLAGEDFSEFSSRAPGVFLFLGAGNPAKGALFPHHHPCFNIDEEALIKGVELHVKSALAFFRKAKTEKED